MYDKLIQILVWEIVKPDRAMIMGGTWRMKSWGVRLKWGELKKKRCLLIAG